MKNKKGILLCVIVLLSMIGIAGFVKWQEYTKTEIIEDLQVGLFALPDEQIARIEIKEADTFVLERQSEKWIEPSYKDIPYETLAVHDFLVGIKQLSSIQRIKNVQDQSAYGIKETSKMLTLYDGENHSQTFRIGNNVAGKEEVYIWSDKDECIYTVPKEQAAILEVRKEDLVEKEMNIPLVDEMKKIQLKKKGEESILFSKEPIDGLEGYNKWKIEGAFTTKHYVSNLQMEPFLKSIGAFQREKFVTTRKEASQYELTIPNLTLTINDSYTILFGKREDGYIYFTYNEDPYIYKMKEECLQQIDKMEPLKMIRKQVYVPDIEALEKITIINPQKTFLLDVLHEKNEKQEPVMTSTLDEKVLTTEETAMIIKKISNSVEIAAALQNPSIEQKEDRKSEVTITYELKGGGQKNIELIPYDTSFYILRFENAIEFAVNKQKVFDLFTLLGDLQKEKNV